MFSSNTSQVSEDRLYVEDVFSTYLYAGSSGAQSINNGIDTLNKGGLVWLKNRSSALSHILLDTGLGCTFSGGGNLISNSTNAAGTIAANTFKFDSTGFSFGSAASGGAINASGNDYVSWTFREAPKFFDVVTWSGNNTARTISHSLGVAPGVIIVKAYSGTDASTANWAVYHRSLGNGNWLKLETTDAALTTGNFLWTSTAPTATEFSIAGGGITEVNKTGNTYVAYLFAHDTTSDGIIQCGSFTTDSNGNFANQNLGWEPQWILYKSSSGTGSWEMIDNMRGLPVSTAPKQLRANTTQTEFDGNIIALTPTGFQCTANQLSPSRTYIYIAIRRGPMRTPTTGTSVWAVDNRGGGPPAHTSGFPVDFAVNMLTTGGFETRVFSRLLGANKLVANTTDAEAAEGDAKFDYMTGWNSNTGTLSTYYSWMWRRAPSFMDVVCYTGNNADQTLNHNLGVAPEMIIRKRRNNISNWEVYHVGFGLNKTLELNNDGGGFNATNVWPTAPTATTFTVGSGISVAGQTNVAYLFASCPGVSKVGSYTGNGSSQTINCGFSGGARFVMIKRTGSTGDWYVWDTARGIVAGNDPHLSLNTTAAEVTTDDTIDTASSGFVVNQVTATNVNVNAATYIFMAVA